MGTFVVMAVILIAISGGIIYLLMKKGKIEDVNQNNIPDAIEDTIEKMEKFAKKVENVAETVAEKVENISDKVEKTTKRVAEKVENISDKVEKVTETVSDVSKS